MAYNALTHGAGAILYWGSNNIDDPAFRQSMYAMTSELSVLQPFLTGKSIPEARATVIRDLFEPPGDGVRVVARQAGDDLLLVLVNEDEHRHLGVDVSGLAGWNGRTLTELYGADEAEIDNGNLAIRMKPLEARLYCTSRRFETSRQTGRSYVSPLPEK